MRNLKTCFSAIAVALGMAPDVYIQAVDLRNLSTSTTPYAVLFGNWHQLIQPTAQLAALFPVKDVALSTTAISVIAKLFQINLFQVYTVKHAVWQFLHQEQLQLVNSWVQWYLAQRPSRDHELRLGLKILNLAYQANLVGELNIAASFTRLSQAYLSFLLKRSQVHSAGVPSLELSRNCNFAPLVPSTPEGCAETGSSEVERCCGKNVNYERTLLTLTEQYLATNLASALLTLTLTSSDLEFDKLRNQFGLTDLAALNHDTQQLVGWAQLGMQVTRQLLYSYQQRLYHSSPSAKQLLVVAPDLIIDPEQLLREFKSAGILAMQIVGYAVQTNQVGPALALLELVSFGPPRLVTPAGALAFIQHALSNGFKRYYTQLQKYVQYQLDAEELIYLTDKRPRERQAYRIKRKALGKSSNKSLKLADTNQAYQAELISRGLPVWGVLRYLAYPTQLIGTQELRSRFHKRLNKDVATHANQLAAGSAAADLPADLFGNLWYADGHSWVVQLSPTGQLALGCLSADGQTLRVSFDGRLSA